MNSPDKRTAEELLNQATVAVQKLAKLSETDFIRAMQCCKEEDPRLHAVLKELVSGREVKAEPTPQQPEERMKEIREILSCSKPEPTTGTADATSKTTTTEVKRQQSVDQQAQELAVKIHGMKPNEADIYLTALKADEPALHARVTDLLAKGPPPAPDGSVVMFRTDSVGGLSAVVDHMITNRVGSAAHVVLEHLISEDFAELTAKLYRAYKGGRILTKKIAALQAEVKEADEAIIDALHHGKLEKLEALIKKPHFSEKVTGTP